jgi:integrase
MGSLKKQKAIAPSSKQAWVRDETVRGLYKRVTNRSATWAVKARRRGYANVVTVTIGPCEVVSIRTARLRAKEILAQLAEGIDPNAKRKTERLDEERRKQEELARSITLAEALDRFLRVGDRKTLTIKDCKQTITRNFADWLSRPVQSITGTEVQQRFLDIRARVLKKRQELNKRQVEAGEPLTQFRNKEGQGEAQRAFRYLSAIFNMLRVDEVNGKPILDRNPVDSLKAKKLTRALIPRERYLMPNEREELIHELSTASHPEYAGPLTVDDVDFVYLLLMTGLRIDEARQLKWEDINFRESIFTARNTKNRRDHTLPMTKGVERLLRNRNKMIKAHSDWVFPSSIDPSKCSSMSRTFERLREVTKINFNAHDLRRTVATIASEMGFDLERIGAVLNHTKSGITSRYVQTPISSLRETLQCVENAVLLIGIEGH